MTTLILILSVLPALIGLMVTGDFSQFMYKPSYGQIRFVMKYRWPLLGASVLLWAAGLALHLFVAPVDLWVLLATGILMALFNFVGFLLPGYVLFRALHNPDWISVEDGNARFPMDEPVIGLDINGDARAYPIEMILRPHMIKDVVGGVPVTMSYCMLCNSAMAFKREFGGQPLELMTPLQWENNLMVYNPASDHLIQQITQKIVGGPNDGELVTSYPTQVTSWGAWQELHPHTQVLFHPPEKGFDRFVRTMLRTKIHEPNMEQEAPIFPTITRFDSRLPNKSKVMGVSVGEMAKAYAVDSLTHVAVLNDSLEDQPVLVAYNPGTGIGNVFERRHEGRVLHFHQEEGVTGSVVMKDEETGSRWDMAGRAISGPLAGEQLSAIPHFNHVYWYSWINFFPKSIFVDLAASVSSLSRRETANLS